MTPVSPLPALQVLNSFRPLHRASQEKYRRPLALLRPVPALNGRGGRGAQVGPLIRDLSTPAAGHHAKEVTRAQLRKSPSPPFWEGHLPSCGFSPRCLSAWYFPVATVH